MVERGWVAPSRGVARLTRGPGIPTLSLIGIPLAVLVAFASVQLQTAAASDCHAISAGGRFAATFVTFPILIASLSASFFLLALALRSRLGRGAMVVGALAVGLVAVWYLAGTHESILHVGSVGCADGFAPWWPRWLAR